MCWWVLGSRNLETRKRKKIIMHQWKPLFWVQKTSIWFTDIYFCDFIRAAYIYTFLSNHNVKIGNLLSKIYWLKTYFGLHFSEWSIFKKKTKIVKKNYRLRDYYLLTIGLSNWKNFINLCLFRQTGLLDLYPFDCTFFGPTVARLENKK